jgi:hypothetical protein
MTEDRDHLRMRQIIDRKLERYGVSGPGRDWLIKALHPAGLHRSPGLPDESSTAVVRPDYRVQATIIAPPDVSAWDCLIWSPPGDVNTIFWATGPAGIDFGAANASAGCVVGWIQLQPSTVGDLASSVTFTTMPANRSISAVTSLPASNACAFRHQYKSFTAHLVASAVADQGQVYAAQFSPELRNTGIHVYDYDPVPGGINAIWGPRYTCVLPTNETDLAAMAPGYYTDAAREGVYVPLRLSGPTQPFARGVPGLPYGVVNSGEAAFANTDLHEVRVGCSIEPTDHRSPTSWVYKVMTDTGMTAQINGDFCFSRDTGYDNMNIGVAIFRGLQGGSGGQFAASIMLKVNVGLEVAPNPAASDRVFVEAPAPYEAKALEAYFAMSLELRDAYPASFNSLGDILDKIGSFAGKVWDAVEPRLVGVASDVANGAAGALGTMVGRVIRGGSRQQMIGGPGGGSTRARSTSTRVSVLGLPPERSRQNVERRVSYTVLEPPRRQPSQTQAVMTELHRRAGKQRAADHKIRSSSNRAVKPALKKR